MSDALAKVEPKQRDSLLISLKELRSIESRRIDAEREEQQRLEREQRRAAREVAVRAEEQRRLQEDRERERVAGTEREERLRLAEAERRARVEAEMQLSRERLQLELTAATPAARRGGAWGTVSIVLIILLSGGLVLVSLELHKRVDELRSARSDQARANQLSVRFARTEQSLLLAQARLRAQTGELRSLRDELLRRRPPATPSPHTTTPRRPRRPPKGPTAKPQIRPGCDDPDDPICGITDSQEGRSRAGARRR